MKIVWMSRATQDRNIQTISQSFMHLKWVQELTNSYETSFKKKVEIKAGDKGKE